MSARKNRNKSKKSSGFKGDTTTASKSEKAATEKNDSNNNIPPAMTRLTTFLEGHEKLVVLGLFFLGFGLRLWNVFEMRAGDPFYAIPSVDPAVYYDWAKRIASGEGFGEGVFFLSPLYPYFMGAVFWIFGPGFTAIRVIQAVLGGLNCVLIYYIGKKTFNIRVGFLAGLLQSIYAVSIFYESVFLITALQTPLNLAMILVLVWSDGRLSVKRSILAGALLGLSTIARPNILLFGVLASAFILIGFRSHLPISRRALRVLIFCGAAGVFVLPVTWHNYSEGDDLVMVSAQGGVNFYIGNGPGANGHFQVPPIFSTTAADDPIQQRAAYTKYAEEKSDRTLKPSEISDFWYAKSLEHIAADPGQWVKLIATKIGLFFNHYEIFNSRDFESSRAFSRVLGLPLPTFGFIAPLSIIGMLAGFISFRRAYFLYAMVATYVATGMIFFVLAHYRLPTVGVLIIFAAFALDYGIGILHQRRIRIFFAGLILLLAATSFTHMKMVEDMNRFSIHFNLGNKYRSMKKFDLAVTSYKKAIELSPNYISAANNLAITYETKGDKEAAANQWEIVKKIAKKRGSDKYIDRANYHLQRLKRTTEM